MEKLKHHLEKMHPEHTFDLTDHGKEECRLFLEVGALGVGGGGGGFWF